MKKVLKFLSAMLVILTTFSSVVSAHNAMTIYADKPVITHNDVDFTTAGVPYLINGNIYVPADDVLKYCGFTLGWDDSIKSIVATKNDISNYIVLNTNYMWIGPEKVEFDSYIKLIDGVVYMPLTMVAALDDSSLYFVGDIEVLKQGFRDLLQDTVIYDTYRLAGKSIGTYKSITIVDNIGMERLYVPAQTAKGYAAVVNSVGNALPQVNVYNIAVPTACEFYIPKKLYTNQTEGIRTIYKNLNDNVMPINVVKPLMEHAAEKIYYNTDHHWTQRGAYYAYKAFMENKGEDVPPLTSFQKNDYWKHVGSFASFTKGTAGQGIMRSNPELLERFIPLVESTGAAYGDMYMRNKLATLKAVNTNSTTYSAFMGGDNPLAVFTTGTKNGKKLVVIKESFGTAFSSWALNNYEEIYIIDPRHLHGMNLHKFYDMVKYDDLVIINYPGGIGSTTIRQGILNMIR